MSNTNNPAARTSAPHNPAAGGAGKQAPADDTAEERKALEAHARDIKELLDKGEVSPEDRTMLMAELDDVEEALEDLDAGRAPHAGAVQIAAKRCCKGGSCHSPRIKPVDPRRPRGKMVCEACGLRFDYKAAGILPPTRQDKVAAQGIVCPNKACQSHRHRVKHTRRRKGRVVRERECVTCGYIWKTEEKAADKEA